MSSTQAKQFHSVTIGNKNTWDDWHLVPSSRPTFNPPSAKTHFVDIPGGDGIIDLTDSVSGRVTYGARTGSWEFIVINSGQVEYNATYDEWYERYTKIMEYLQGYNYRAILDDDPGYYYKGRFTIDEWNSSPGNSTITIKYTVDPYKRQLYTGGDDWLWDPFNFETGVIKSYKNFPVNGTARVVYISTGDVSGPTIIQCSAPGMSVTYQGTSYSLNRGTNELYAISFEQGENVLTFSGNGRVTIEATGGML